MPGHSAGHVAFWRESDGVLILGDVLANMDQLTAIPGLHEPKPYLTPDPAENRRSARKLALLEPKLVLFGHGAPLRDTKKFVDFVDALPAYARPAASLRTPGLRQVRSRSRSRTAWMYCFAGSVHHRPAYQAPTLPQRSPARYSRPRSTVFSHSILPSK